MYLELIARIEPAMGEFRFGQNAHTLTVKLTDQNKRVVANQIAIHEDLMCADYMPHLIKTFEYEFRRFFEKRAEEIEARLEAEHKLREVIAKGDIAIFDINAETGELIQSLEDIFGEAGNEDSNS